MGDFKRIHLVEHEIANAHTVILSAAKDLMPVASGDEVFRLRSRRQKD